MSELLNRINSTTNLMEVYNILQPLKKKDLKVVADSLNISLLSKDNKEDVLNKIMNHYKAVNMGEVFKKMMG
jgi:hypothetical protein